MRKIIPPGRLIERLDRVLRLTGEQRDQIDGILVSRGERLTAVQREVAERAAPRGLGGGRGRGGPRR